MKILFAAAITNAIKFLTLQSLKDLWFVNVVRKPAGKEAVGKSMNLVMCVKIACVNCRA